MFQRKYIIKVYYDGKNIPDLEFCVDAQCIVIQDHNVKIDGITLQFSDKHYIAVEMA